MKENQQRAKWFSYKYTNKTVAKGDCKKSPREINAPSYESRCLPSVENINVIFRRIWPDVQFNYADSQLQCLDDGKITAVTAELITGQIRVVPGVNEIVGQRCVHVLMDLETR
jgi:hypothetical protein